jgi:phosphatidylinositol-3,4,5-trisphosphate 3-phosphatase/dual-specificity protein phosphatase PTEN
MGFPAQKLEGVYRNHIDDVFRFLEQKHRDRYKLYNLCSERHYPADKFHGRVAHYPFDDHNPPKIEDMDRFCDDVADWLRQDEHNVVAIHCKAGKGRTGVMICAFLMYAQIVPNAAAALLMYGSKRTSDAKGVTIPSQRRYVEYYEKLVTRHIRYSPVTLAPDSISFSPLPNLNGGNYTFFFVMYGQEKREIWRSEAKKAGRNSFEYVFPDALSLTGDVKIEFKHRDALNVRKQSLFSFWFNTFFVLNPVSDQSCLSSAGLPLSPGPESASAGSNLLPVNGNGIIPPDSESGTRG